MDFWPGDDIAPVERDVDVLGRARLRPAAFGDEPLDDLAARHAVSVGCSDLLERHHAYERLPADPVIARVGFRVVGLAREDLLGLDCSGHLDLGEATRSGVGGS
jgi:hypothetical protein